MSSMSSVAGLSKYIKTLPSTKISTVNIIVASFIIGALYFIINPVYDMGLLEQIIYGGAFGFFVLGIASIMSGGMNQQWVTSLHGINLKTKHSMFLSFLSMLAIGFIMLGGAIISVFFNVDLSVESIIFGVILSFAFNIIVLWSTSSIGFTKSVFIGAMQPLLTLTMFIIITFVSHAESIIGLGITPLFIKAIIGSIIFAIFIYSFISIVESPMKKNLGIGVLDLLSLFIAHMNEGSSSLEGLFDDMGETIETLISYVSFKKGNEIKSLFVSPCVHPGPLGDIGGSNMPTTLANKFDHFTMIAHGPSTHDFNPVSTKEVDKIEIAIKNSLENLEYSNIASDFKRYNEKKSNIGVQFFNKGMILLSTFAPYGCDDIEFSVGLTMLAYSQKTCEIDDAIIVDCHNSFTEESGEVLPGNPEVFELIDGIQKIDHTPKESTIKVGCHEDLMETLDKTSGVGDSGIKTMIVEVNNQRTAYVLFDSNNMEIGFRQEIIEATKDLAIDEIEVMTTDTHSVNTLAKGYNPIGTQKRKEIIQYVRKTIQIAIEDLEEVEVGTKTERISLKTFGPNNSTELISTMSSIVSVSKIIAPILFLAALIITLMWLLY
ncbi:DUF2070 family protein [Methanobrevibacter sp. DSM 116169]|uniref:DUF2070 family protein n=1 Tax=Methanobrevibacter sp. DSM 116169 TaxID=3242727 RepID=UPI0038FC639A